VNRNAKRLGAAHDTYQQSIEVIIGAVQTCTHECWIELAPLLEALLEFELAVPEDAATWAEAQTMLRETNKLPHQDLTPRLKAARHASTPPDAPDFLARLNSDSSVLTHDDSDTPVSTPKFARTNGGADDKIPS